jgi:hypothetical protein
MTLSRSCAKEFFNRNCVDDDKSSMGVVSFTTLGRILENPL